MIYTIKKGCHRSVIFPRLTFKKSVSGSFTFLSDFEEIESTSKIVGLSDNWHHHRDSVRIGFRKDKGIIKIYGIFYARGKREIKEITTTELNQENQFSIQIFSNFYKIIVNKKVCISKRQSKWDFIRYRLFPYFGGKEKTSSELQILLKT